MPCPTVMRPVSFCCTYQLLLAACTVVASSASSRATQLAEERCIVMHSGGQDDLNVDDERDVVAVRVCSLVK